MFLLSKENIELARAEVLALTNAANYEVDDNILILDTKEERLYARLAFTKAIYRFLFSCKEDELEKSLKGFDWKSIYDENFCIRTHGGIKQKEKDLASYVWNSVEEPRVELKYCKTKIELFKLANKIYCGKLLHIVTKDFLKRKSHLRPALHPTSLSPRLARAMINLTGIKKGDVYDPFCGSGGILIEAGMMGFKTIGLDINDYVLKKARENLDYYGIRYVELEQRDALTLKKKLDYVVTDLPYGRNTKLTLELEKLYLDFLKLLDEHLVYKAVVGYPDFVDFKKLIKKTKLKLLHEFSVYLHKSLTKKIVVLGKS